MSAAFSRDLSELKIDHQSTSVDSKPSPFRALIFFAAAVATAFVLFKLLAPAGTSGPAPRNEAPATKTAGEQRPAEPLAKDGSPAPPVPPMRVEVQAPRAASLDATGYVVAQRKAAVSSKATGRLLELRVREGDVVQAEQILGVLESADLRAVAAEHEASLLAARSRVRVAQAELDDARRQNDRVLSLNVPGAVSKNDRDTMEYRFRKAAADLEAVRAAVTVEEARLEKSKVDVEYTYIRAPFAGTVLSKNADVGEVVAPFGSSANARGALLTLADMESLQVEADVSEANLSKVKVGQKCVITLDSYPEKKYEGVVESIVPTVDRAKGTVTVKLRFVNKDERVIPEMSAKVSFLL